MFPFLTATLRAYRNKVANKTTGVIHVRHQGKRRGDALISFITEPFTKAPWEFFSDPHTNPWSAKTVVSLLAERGYDVDIINWDNTTFIPQKQYAVCIDINHNLKRLAQHLPPNCLKVFFSLASDAQFQNSAEVARLAALEERRGISLPTHRSIPENDAPRYANYIVGYGNATVHGTFEHFGKPIVHIPAPVMAQFDFPEQKDFDAARQSFLWFGGGGAVHKGLDLTLEALANTEYELHIVGPAASEPAFTKHYATELSAPNIHVYPRPRIDKEGDLTIDGKPFMGVMNRCGAVIFPSASEGGGASALQAMHAGLIPVVTKESGMPEDAPAHFIEPTVEAIKDAATHIAHKNNKEIEEESRAAWSYARTHCTKEAFINAWRRFLDEHLVL